MSKNSLISTTAELEKSLEKICEKDLYSIDTEFVGEGSYVPRLALIQIGCEDSTILLDPLELDPAPLAEFFKSSNLAIMHASDQDLKLLMNWCGTIPQRVFDIQIAAGFLGRGHPSLEELVYIYMEKNLSKSTRLTDWLARPLTKQQITYAREDVVYLVEIYKRIQKELKAKGREEWARSESESLRQASQNFAAPENSWKSIKKINKLRGQDFHLAQKLSNWRELKAKELDIPRRRILADLAVLNISQTRPQTLSELRSLRGMNRSTVPDNASLEEVLEIVSGTEKNSVADSKKGAQREQDALAKKRPSTTLLIAWLNSYAQTLDIYPPLLATRSDISDYFADPPQGRLLEGWRAELLGDSLKRFVAGEASIAIAEDGALVLEERSHRPMNLS